MGRRNLDGYIDKVKIKSTRKGAFYFRKVGSSVRSKR